MHPRGAAGRRPQRALTSNLLNVKEALNKNEMEVGRESSEGSVYFGICTHILSFICVNKYYSLSDLESECFTEERIYSLHIF